MNSRILISSGLALAVASLPLLSGGLSEGEAPRDLWIHPRGETFDSARHYRAPDGELFFKAENDIRAIGDLVVDPTDRSRITAELGPDLFEILHRSQGTLLPVLLWDADGNGSVDHLMQGRVEDRTALFDSPELEKLDLRRTYWQLGIRYVAGANGSSELDGRYLSSVDSSQARVAYRRVDELPAVGSAPGLVILKHRDGVAFDFPDFVENPARYVEDFDALTRIEDEDDWTVDRETNEGRLMTHFDQENLFIVRAIGGFDLEVVWGNVPLTAFFEDFLAVKPGLDGCYSSLDTQLKMLDGSPAKVPHRYFYCPHDSVALFDAPAGYQIYLSALHGDYVHEHTEAGTSVGDNIRLYIDEINPRSATNRSTDRISGNIRAGFSDAGADLKDFFRHTFTGTYPENVHNGQDSYRASIFTAIPLSLWSLARLRPGEAVGTILTGTGSAIDGVASAVSATFNGVVNPVMQVSVGAVSTGAADRVMYGTGALAMALSKNLIVAERSVDAFNPVSAWNHNRGFASPRYTRTDTQLNLDRVFTIVNVLAIRAIDHHNDSSSRNADTSGDGGGGPGGGPPGGGPPGGGPPGGGPPGGGPPGLSKKISILHMPPGNPGNAHTITVSPNAIGHLVHGDVFP